MWARIQDGVVAEMTDQDPKGRFHPTLVWAAAPDGTVAGDLYDGKSFSRPAPPVPTPRRTISGAEFLALFTPTEVQALWAADARLMAGALKVAAQDSANLDSPEMAQMMALAVAKGALTADRAKQVAMGAAPP